MSRFLLAVLLLVVVCQAPLQSRADEDPDDVPISPEFEADEWDFGPYVPVEWPLLRFEAERQITKATLVLRDKLTDDGYEDGTTVEFDGPELLSRLQECFRRPPLRFATPDDGKGGMGWGSINFGELRIETTEDKFFIDLGWEGFHLNRHSTNADTVFWQGKLARLIDEVHLAKTKKRLRLHSPDNLTLAESHAQFFVNSTEMRPEVHLPSDEKVKQIRDERNRRRK